MHPMVLVKAIVSIPALLLMTTATIQLNETDSAFHQAASNQTLPAKVLRLGFVHPIKALCRFTFLRKVHGFGRVGLHLERQFIRGDSGIKIGIAWMLPQVLAIQLLHEINLP